MVNFVVSTQNYHFFFAKYCEMDACDNFVIRMQYCLFFFGTECPTNPSATIEVIPQAHRHPFRNIFTHAVWTTSAITIATIRPAQQNGIVY